MRNWNRRDFGGVAFGVLAAGCAHAKAAPDLIIHGGPIYTGVSANPRVEALRIRDGRFVALGSLADVSANARGARVLDLAGAAAYPGFKDAHCHLGGVGMAAMVLDLVGVESIAALRERLRTYAASHREGAIYGRGWIETHWPERRFPNRADLDDIVGDRPVFLERVDGHAGVVNGAALALAGIDASTANPAGGSIERDGQGRATGMLIDNATSLVQSRLPAPTPAMQREALAQALRLYASRGWTGASNMSTSLAEAMLLQEFAAAGEAPIHTDIYLTPEDSEIVFQRGAFAIGNASVRGVKLYMDGALGSRGAALLAPYSDAHSDGLLVTPPDQLRAFLTRARASNVQVATHAIGDRGNRLVLDAYRDVFANDAAASRAARWRIEHAQVLAREDIPRFAAQGVIASMQPSHAISDLHFAPSRLGPDRLAGAYAWRSLLDSGAIIAAGSDAPVEKGDPLIEFYAAAYRHDLNGFAGDDWRLDQAVGRAEALRMLTWAPAFACFAEAERGTIEVGKRADVSAFSIDLMNAEAPMISTARAVLTVSDGRVAHEAL
ncbi:amidohydrolase [Vitreimonas flagellata]|uniref:amidohydrolase n=1 Tax=Vitreimonas flagellata TaxID=2560861 RepID=UPI001074D344|nr:amidohydrolase [Vitreimonas flagellata]